MIVVSVVAVFHLYDATGTIVLDTVPEVRTGSFTASYYKTGLTELIKKLIKEFPHRTLVSLTHTRLA